MSTNSRSEWNALNYTPPFCSQLMREAEKAGAWTTGISSRRQRGTAINCDLYGYDEALGLCVVQLRQAQFRPGQFTKVRKDYFLIGHNEDGSFFSHPVDSPARSPRALESPEACVQWVLSKIWDCRFEDVGEVERQGDIGLVPVSRLPLGAEKVEGSIILQDSHKLSGDIWLAGGIYYTRRGSRLVHVKGEHEPVKAKGGYYRVQPGVRANVWGFTAPGIGD